jgi:8-oxo-dGTP pyrophosphatase MutT (NUDIX family)
MYAAAEGKSRLGIPKKVGEEFIAKDATKGHAAGVLFVAPDGDILVLLRSATEKNYANHWALPGGKGEAGETPIQTAQREAEEELGATPKGVAKLLDSVVTPTGMAFHTFAQPADKFAPKLNDEHCGYAWVSMERLPQPLHPALGKMLNNRLGMAEDMDHEEWEALRSGFAKWTREEEAEGEHAEDDEHGKLNEKESAEADRTAKERASMPASAFLQPATRKYPVKAMKDGAWIYSRDLLLAAAREARMHGHEDLAKHADSIRERKFGGAQDSALIAFDRESVRTKDKDGRLHIKASNISKATVNPYRGNEIPKWQELGLDSTKVYYLLRDPAELAKGAATFNNLPVLSKHQKVSAEDHDHMIVVGTTGSEAEFNEPHLQNSLAIWTAPAINGIETEDEKEQVKELSCAYSYRADMTPGTFEGKPYDGVMRDIVGNHVALVREGRAGPDVVVADSALQLGWGFNAFNNRYDFSRFG